jgi:hypothetical protein
MKSFGGPKISQWEGVIQKGSREGKEQLKTHRGNSERLE